MLFIAGYPMLILLYCLLLITVDLLLHTLWIFSLFYMMYWCNLHRVLLLYSTWNIDVISMSYCFILHDLSLCCPCISFISILAYPELTYYWLTENNISCYCYHVKRNRGLLRDRERNVFLFGMVMYLLYVFLMHSMITWVILLVIVGKMDYSMFPVCLLFMFRHSLLIHGKVIIILLFKSVFFCCIASFLLCLL